MPLKQLAIAASLAFALVVTPSWSQQSTTRPNILLIIGDDFGMDVTSDMYPSLIDDLVEQYGPMGHNHPGYRAIKGRPASTPTLDQLAQQGMVFSDVWAHPFCSPTRASIITGLFAAKTHVKNYQDPLTQSHTTFVQTLKDQGGYRTGLFGKWHLAGLFPGADEVYPGMKPLEAGFDFFKGSFHAAINTFWDYDYFVQDERTPSGEWREELPPTRSLRGVAPTTYAPVVKVADTIDWIRAQETADADRPWFAWLAFNLSHATIQREPSQMAVPNADTLDAMSLMEMRDCGGEFGSSNVGNCSGEALMRAMTNSMDTLLGKLLDAVDTIDPNTYVIYVSDNGTPMYGRPNIDFIDNMYITKSGRGKGTAYESGARVALAIKGPHIQAATMSHQFAHVADLYPTILELADLDVPGEVANSEGNGTVALDSVSLAPILRGDRASVRDRHDDYVLTETENLMTGGTRQVGARNARYKVICTDGPSNCEFYDLQNDPLEEYPLAPPENCRNYRDGNWTATEQPWHYCRLINVVSENSFL